MVGNIFRLDLNKFISSKTGLHSKINCKINNIEIVHKIPMTFSGLIVLITFEKLRTIVLNLYLALKKFVCT